MNDTNGYYLLLTIKNKGKQRSVQEVGTQTRRSNKETID